MVRGRVIKQEFITISFLALSLAACRRSDQVYRHYSTHIEGLIAGSASRGWLPHWIPMGATDVYVQGDIDTNARWYRFDLSPAGADSLRQTLVAIAADSALVRAPARADSWWLNADFNADWYRGSGNPVPREVVLAFDLRERHIYAWSGLN